VLRRISGSRRQKVTGDSKNYIMRTFVICIHEQIFLGKQIKEDEMGKTHSTYGEMTISYKIFYWKTLRQETTWEM
jgi:hypothetical protein